MPDPEHMLRLYPDAPWPSSILVFPVPSFYSAGSVSELEGRERRTMSHGSRNEKRDGRLQPLSNGKCKSGLITKGQTDPKQMLRLYPDAP